jgi:hypothetical protein
MSRRRTRNDEIVEWESQVHYEGGLVELAYHDVDMRRVFEI